MTDRKTRQLFLFVALVSIGLAGAGCASTANTDSSGLPRAPRAMGDPAYVDLTLAPPAPGIATVQLYRYPNETSLPIIAAGTDQVLSLEFDLLDGESKPLSIEFKHFNRRWEEDYLHSTEYMVGQFQDQILNYRRSIASRSRYVHYSYEFPNASIQFRRSGNYVLTVSDPSSNGDVLVELPFLISEEGADIEYQLRAVPIPGQVGLWSQPIVYIDPGTDPSRDLFDWGACFVKNTRFDLSRCSARPSLFDAPYASFSLELEDSFEPE
ncbi:MAG: type IX secretion system plug protein domain-containing protein, partial [Rhodothermales bacterium]